MSPVDNCKFAEFAETANFASAVNSGVCSYCRNFCTFAALLCRNP